MQLHRQFFKLNFSGPSPFLFLSKEHSKWTALIPCNNNLKNEKSTSFSWESSLYRKTLIGFLGLPVKEYSRIFLMKQMLEGCEITLGGVIYWPLMGIYLDFSSLLWLFKVFLRFLNLLSLCQSQGARLQMDPGRRLKIIHQLDEKGISSLIIPKLSPCFLFLR